MNSKEKIGYAFVISIIALLAIWFSLAVHSYIFFAAVVVFGLVLAILFIVGLRSAEVDPGTPELKRALRARLSAQGFTKENRAERRRMGRIGVAGLIGLFSVLLGGPVLISVFIRLGGAPVMSICCGFLAATILAIPLSIVLMRISLRASGKLVQPLNNWMDDS